MALWTTAFVVSQANIARLLGPVAPKVLEVQTAFSARRYVEILDSMDAEATARFRSHYYPDFVHPAIYAMALRSAGTRLGGEWVPLSPATRRALAVVPVLSAAGDYVENVVGLHFLDHRDRITDSRFAPLRPSVLPNGCSHSELSDICRRVLSEYGYRENEEH